MTNIFTEYSQGPLGISLAILSFFVWAWIMFWIDWYVSRDYYSKKWEMMIECVKQWMVYDTGDCIPYKKK